MKYFNVFRTEYFPSDPIIFITFFNFFSGFPSVLRASFILTNYYKKASMLIISSRSEGGPRVALEALYQEIPVISTNVGHMPEILPKELLAEPNNLDSLKELVETYVGNENYSQDSIYEYVKQEFSGISQSKKILNIYKELFIS